MEKNILVGITRVGNCYNAHAPHFPGCLATGQTADEAKQGLVRALQEHIKGMLSDGEYIPEGDDFYSVISVSVPIVDKSQINGGTLKAYRKRIGLTQAELAEKLDVSKETISEWERDRREIPGTLKFALESVVS